MATKTRYKYIEEPDSKLKCAICEGVAKDPVQEGNCGKLFCGRCIKKRGETKPCLHCTKSPNYFKDTESKLVFAYGNISGHNSLEKCYI